MARSLRAQAREILELHKAGQHEEALARGMELARANPGSALALNLVGSLHRHSGSAAWDSRASDDDEAASALELYHHRLALDAFSAAAQIAPDCVMTAIAHAEALAACGRLAEAPVELFRICSMAEANHTDPAVHHVGYDLVLGGSNAKTRKRDAVYRANVVMQDFEAMVSNEIVPIEAAKMLGGDVAVDQMRQRARLFSQSYPYSARAQLLCVYVELEHVRALDLPADKKRHLRRILALISDAARNFDCSLLIALFHAKVLFVLDEFDESERECRRALCIEKPTDPNLDDIPPAVSVPGADYDSRVSYLQKQFRVFLKHIIVVAALYWPSIKRSQHHARIISVKVGTLQAHCNRIDPSAAKTISDAHRYLKKHNSWSFLICPNSRCDGRKFMDTESLCLHMRSKHRDELWKKLESILGPDLNENASNDDHSLDGITLCQDSGQHDIFSLPRIQDMFESLLLSPSIGIQAQPLAEMRQRKCREGFEVLEDIKEKLKMLPEDVLSTEFEEFRFGIQNLWLKFLKNSLLDYREVILPLARSFQRIEIKQWIARNVNDPNRSTGDANIDAVSGKIPVAPDHEGELRNVRVLNADYIQEFSVVGKYGDLLDLAAIHAREEATLSDVRVVNSNSGTMVGQSSSDPPADVDESVMNIAARIAEVELDKKVLNRLSTSESQDTLSDVLASITSPVDTGFFCKTADCSTVTSVDDSSHSEDAGVDGSYLLDLAPEIICVIAQRAAGHARRSVAAMRGVCRSWRDAVPLPTRGPWLVLSPVRPELPTLFLAIVQGALVIQRNPLFIPPRYAQCWSSCNGLLALRVPESAGYTLCPNCGRGNPLPEFPDDEDLELNNMCQTRRLVCAFPTNEPLICWAKKGHNDQWFEFNYGLGVFPKSIYWDLDARVACIAAAPSSLIIDQNFEERVMPISDELQEELDALGIDHHQEPPPEVINFELEQQPMFVTWGNRGHHVFQIDNDIYMCILLRHAQDSTVQARLYVFNIDGQNGVMQPANNIGNNSLFLGSNQAFVTVAGPDLLPNTAYIVDDDLMFRAPQVIAINFATGHQTTLVYPPGIGRPVSSYVPASWVAPAEVINGHCS